MASYNARAVRGVVREGGTCLILCYILNLFRSFSESIVHLCTGFYYVSIHLQRPETYIPMSLCNKSQFVKQPFRHIIAVQLASHVFICCLSTFEFLFELNHQYIRWINGGLSDGCHEV